MFEEFKRALEGAAGKTEEGRGHLRTAIERQEEAASTLLEVAQTSQDPEMQTALAQQNVVADDLRRVFVMLGQVVAAIGAYQASISGGAPTPSSSAPEATPSPTVPTQPHAITNSHGDQYPTQAAGLIENLPPRVQPGAKQRTKGRAKVGDTTIPISSGEDPYWVNLIRDRLDAIDVQTEQLEHHAEIKVAAMMAEWKVPHAEVAINYTPCGYERQKRFQDVCHKVLPKFLPPGYSVTVYGTTRDNKPFQWNYRGQEQG